MRLRLGYVCMILASRLTLAQSNPVSFTNEPGGSAVVSPTQRGLSFEQSGTRASKLGGRQKAASQTSGLSFASAVVYGTGGDDAVSLAAADLTGNGKIDIVVANCGSGNFCSSSVGVVGVLLGNGNGTFQTAVTYSSGGYGSASLAVADVNGDGKPDLLVANNCADAACATGGSVSVLLGNGDGTFQTAVPYGSGGYGAVSVAVADVNGDGKPDLVVVNSCANINGSCAENNSGDGSVGVLLGHGDGTFQAALLGDSGGFQPAYTAVGDMNGDGKPDAIVAQCYGPGFGCLPGEVGVLLGNEDGTFQTAVIYNALGDYPNSVAIADLNGDGKLDVVLADTGTGDHDDNPGAATVLLGNGDGTLQPGVIYPLGPTDYSGGYASSVAVADVNGDGKLDLVVGGEPGANVFLGNGDGIFQTVVTFSSGGLNPASVALADVNGDGLTDILVTNECGITDCPYAGSVAVLINTGTTAVLSPANLTFAPQAPGTSSSPQTVTLTNIATAALTLSGITFSGADATGFSQTNNCPSALAQNASCQIKVTFIPTAGGGQTASLRVSDSAHGSPQTVALSGTGQDFSLGITPGSTTVTPGQAGNYTMTVTPVSGFSQKVALTCSGAPAQSTCMVSPSSVTLNGTSNATASVGVVTSGTTAGLKYPGGDSPSGLLALCLAPFSFGLVVLTKAGGVRGRTRLLRILVLVCMFAVGAGISSCGGGGGNSGGGGGGGGSGTPPGSYVLSLTGSYTSGGVTLTHTVKTTLVVQ
jgi:FG-GAP-like repeat